MVIKYIDRATGEIKIENPPKVRLLKILYDNPFGRTVLLKLAIRKFFTDLNGKKMNNPKSLKHLKPFVEEMGINMDESRKSIDEFKHFNDFFYRKLKPDVRQIGEGLISPGDGKVLAFKNYSEVNHFYVKGRDFTLLEFLGDPVLAKKYHTSSMVILRLAPDDYHRYHFPYEGIPSETKIIDGKYYSVSPYALYRNFTRVFAENKRAICHLEVSPDNTILIAPVGATMVGSIHSTYTPNQPVNKGDEMGYFSFGGSSLVLLFNREHFRIHEDILENTAKKLETYVKMGESIGEVVQSMKSKSL